MCAATGRCARTNAHTQGRYLDDPSMRVITTSGVCDAPPLLCALLALGADHILFGTDYPFEDMATATQFLRTAPVSEADRSKIAHGNAERLLGL
jgi:2,3-dihydroxybenzoate decarboxylase